MSALQPYLTFLQLNEQTGNEQTGNEQPRKHAWRMQLSHYCVGVVAVLLCTTSALQSDYDYYPTQYYYDNNDDDHDISHTKHDYYTQKGPCPTFGLTVSTAEECERAAVLLKLKADEVEAFRGHAYGCYWENNAGVNICMCMLCT